MDDYPCFPLPGYPDENATVPDIGRKPLNDVVTYV